MDQKQQTASMNSAQHQMSTKYAPANVHFEAHPECDVCLSISIVNYNSSQDLEACLNSIRQNPPSKSYRVWVIDNASSESLSRLIDSNDDVQFLMLKKNLGYGKANNKVMLAERSQYHLILNPDILITKGTLDILLDYMDENPKVGICSPKMLYGDGQLQSSCRRFPTLATLFSRGLFPHHQPDFMNRYLMLDFDHQSIRSVDWNLGSFLLGRTALFNLLGGFHPQYFMYYEDIDLCFRTWQTGFKVVYHAPTSIIHHYKRSSAVKKFNLLKCHHFISALLFFKSTYKIRRWRSIL